MAGIASGDKRRALGRGLESLLPSRPKPTVDIAASAATAEPAGKPLEIPVEQIDRNPYQTRKGFDDEKLKELAASIAASGVVQPIIVRAGANGRYTLITGERRWLASQRAGKTTIPATQNLHMTTTTVSKTSTGTVAQLSIPPCKGPCSSMPFASIKTSTTKQFASSLVLFVAGIRTSQSG